MTTLAEKIAIMQAFADGKTIQYYNEDMEEWRPARAPIWNWQDKEYRIKPAEPKQVVSYCYRHKVYGTIAYGADPQHHSTSDWQRFPAGDITGVISE